MTAKTEAAAREASKEGPRVVFGPMTVSDYECGDAEQSAYFDGEVVAEIVKSTANVGSVLCPRWVAGDYNVSSFDDRVSEEGFGVALEWRDQWTGKVRKFDGYDTARKALAAAKAHVRAAF